MASEHYKLRFSDSLRNKERKKETFPTMFYLDNNSSVLVTFSENNHLTS